MKFARMFTALICLIALALFTASIPAFFIEVRDHCTNLACEAFYVPPPPAGWLEIHQISPGQFAFSYEIIYIVFGLVYIAAGIIIFYKKSNEIIGPAFRV